MTIDLDMARKLLGEERAFVRVYRLPLKLINGYCFGGGVPITFTNVDWFETPVAEGRRFLIDHIKEKQYFDPLMRFLVQSDHPDFTFMIELSGGAVMTLPLDAKQRVSDELDLDALRKLADKANNPKPGWNDLWAHDQNAYEAAIRKAGPALLNRIAELTEQLAAVTAERDEALLKRATIEANWAHMDREHSEALRDADIAEALAASEKERADKAEADWAASNARMKALVSDIEADQDRLEATNSRARVDAMEEAARIADTWAGGLDTHDAHRAALSVAAAIREAAAQPAGGETS